MVTNNPKETLPHAIGCINISRQEISIVLRLANGEIIVDRLLTPEGAQRGVVRALRAFFEAQEAVVFPLRLYIRLDHSLLLFEENPFLITSLGFGDLLRGIPFQPDAVRDDYQTELQVVLQRIIELPIRISSDGSVQKGGDCTGLAQSGLQKEGATTETPIVVSFPHGIRSPKVESEVVDHLRSKGFKRVISASEISPLPHYFVERTRQAVREAREALNLEELLSALESEFSDAEVFMLTEAGILTPAQEVRHTSSLRTPSLHRALDRFLTQCEIGEGYVVFTDCFSTECMLRSNLGEPQRSILQRGVLSKSNSSYKSCVSVPIGLKSILVAEHGVLTFRSKRDTPGATLEDLITYGTQPTALSDDDRSRIRECLKNISESLEEQGAKPLPAEEICLRAVKIWQTEVALGLRRLRYINDVAAKSCFVAGKGSEALLSYLPVYSTVRDVYSHSCSKDFSAYLLQFAPVGSYQDYAVGKELDEKLSGLSEIIQERISSPNRLETRSLKTKIEVTLRYSNPEHVCRRVTVEAQDSAGTVRSFEREHLAQYLSIVPHEGFLVEWIRHLFYSESTIVEEGPMKERGGPVTVNSPASGQIPFQYQREQAPIVPFDALPVGKSTAGPLLLETDDGMISLCRGWSFCSLSAGLFVFQREEKSSESESVFASLETTLGVLSAFVSGSEDLLARGSHSIESFEWGDYFVGLANERGQILYGSSTSKIHLAAAHLALREFVASHQHGIEPEDMIVENIGYNHGTHLNDVTAFSPIFIGGKHRWTIISRAHVKDIGGLVPGGVAADAHSYEQEGVSFEALRLVDGSKLCEKDILSTLRSGDFAVRSPRKTVIELRAHIRAHEFGRAFLFDFLQFMGEEAVQQVVEHAKRTTADLVKRIAPGKFARELDGNLILHSTISIEGEKLRFDFQESSLQQNGNRNASLAVTFGAVLNGLNSIPGAQITPNDHTLRSFIMEVPKRSFVDAESPVGIGSAPFETALLIEDFFLHSQKIRAHSTGSAQLLTFQWKDYTWTETFPGGTGAMKARSGMDAQFLGFSSNSMSDPELLESLLPIVFDSVILRKGSGGAGKQPGGNGVIVRLRFLAEMIVGVITGPPKLAPSGLSGGRPGMAGWNYIERSDGTLTPLGGHVRVRIRPGDIVVLETPGGGGYGAPERRA